MTEKTRRPAPELLADPDIAKAIEQLEIINYTEAEMEQYERYWDSVSVEATWKHIGHRDGLKEGMEKGIEQGREEGIEKGRAEGIEQGRAEGIEQGRAERDRQIVLSLLDNGFDIATIEKVTGLAEAEIRVIVE